MLQLAEDEAWDDQGAADEARLDDVGDAAVDDHGRIEERALLSDAVRFAAADIVHERTELGTLDRARGATRDAEDDRADDRRVPPYIAGKERERERKEEPEHETGARAERAADDVTRGCLADACGERACRDDGDIRSAEPAEDRAGGGEKNDDEETVRELSDLRDLEQRGAEIEAEDPADECDEESDE